MSEVGTFCKKGKDLDDMSHRIEKNRDYEVAQRHDLAEKINLRLVVMDSEISNMRENNASIMTSLKNIELSLIDEKEFKKEMRDSFKVMEKLKIDKDLFWRAINISYAIMAVVFLASFAVIALIFFDVQENNEILSAIKNNYNIEIE